MAKEVKEKVYNSPFHERVVGLLKEKGYATVDEDRVAISVDNKTPFATVYYNFTSTGIHLNKDEVDERVASDAGFKYWSTWHWGENC